jgi:hypothetical protein
MILICSKANHQRFASDLHDVTVITDARNKKKSESSLEVSHANRT